MFLSEKGKDRRCLYEDGDEEDLSLSQLHVLNKKYGHLVKGDSDIHPTTTPLSNEHMSNVQTGLDDSVPTHSEQDNLHPGDFIEYYATPFVCGDPKGYRISQIHSISGKGDDVLVYTANGDVLDWIKSVRKVQINPDGTTHQSVGGWLNLDETNTVAGSRKGCPIQAESDRFRKIYNNQLKLMKEDAKNKGYNQFTAFAPPLKPTNKSANTTTDMDISTVKFTSSCTTTSFTDKSPTFSSSPTLDTNVVPHDNTTSSISTDHPTDTTVANLLPVLCAHSTTADEDNVCASNNILPSTTTDVTQGSNLSGHSHTPSDMVGASNNILPSTTTDGRQGSNLSCHSPTPSDMVATMEAVVCDFVDNSPTFQREIHHSQLSSPLQSSHDTNVKSNKYVDGSRDPIVETTFFPSPLSAKMRRIPPRDLDRWFLSRSTQVVNGKTVECIEYRTMGNWKVLIESSVVLSLIDGSLTSNDELYNVKWIAHDTRKRSSVLRKILRPITPDPLELRFKNSAVVKYISLEHASSVKRQGKKIRTQHEYVAYIHGWCQASDEKDNFTCPGTWVCGFTYDALVGLMKGALSIEIGLCVTKNCIHRKGHTYGQLRGEERKALVDSLAKRQLDVWGNANVHPKTIIETSVQELSTSASHAQNHGGIAGNVGTAYNLKRESVVELRKHYGLSGFSDMVDITRSNRIINGLDIEKRRLISDNSNDYCGILRTFEIGNKRDSVEGKQSTGYRVTLWNKTSIELYHILCNTGCVTLNYDGTGSEVDHKVDTLDGEYILHNVLSIGKNVFIRQDYDNVVQRKLHPKIIGQFFSNRNATSDHSFFLGEIEEARQKLFPFDKKEGPLLFSTDCAGQLENAALLTWRPSSGVPMNKIRYSNISLLICLEIERCKHSLEAADTHIKILQTYQPVLLHECKSHSIRDGKDWSRSIKRSPDHRKYVGQFTRMLMHIFCNAAGDWNISESLVHLGLLTYICSESNILCDPWSDDVKIQKHSDSKEMIEIGKQVHTFITNQKIRLEGLTENCLAELIDSEMNIQETKLQYLSRKFVTDVAQAARDEQLNCFHIYAKERNEDSALLRISVLHGINHTKLKAADDHDYSRDLNPQLKEGQDVESYSRVEFESGFYQYVGGMELLISNAKTGVKESAIPNPAFNKDIVTYLDTRRSGKLPLWSGAIVKCASIAKSAKMDYSNQMSEAVIRWMKEDSSFQAHCKDFALYMNYSWMKHVATDALYATEVANLEAQVESSTKRKAKKQKQNSKSNTVSDDIRLLDTENKEESLWGKAGWTTNGSLLKRRIEQAFRHCLVGLEAKDKQHEILKYYAKHLGKTFIGSSTYSIWMSDKRKSSKPLSCDTCVVMDSYASLVEKGDFEVIEKINAKFRSEDET